MAMHSTRDFHRGTLIDLMKEFTLCESLANLESPSMKVLSKPKPYGALIGDFLISRRMLEAGSTIIELGGGYGSLMRGLLDAHGKLIRKAFMVDLSPMLLRKQKERLKCFTGKVSFIRADIHEIMGAIKGVDLLIINEVIGDLDTLTGLDPDDLPEKAGDFINTYRLDIPSDQRFTLNSGALSLVEAICSKAIPAFITEHASDPIIPEDMPFLAEGLAIDSYPREIPLSGHSEYTIRFSHLIRVARSFGRKTATGPLIGLLGIPAAPSLRFIFLNRVCATEEQEIAYEYLDHVREYRWMTIE
jgi:hypothetical protein